MLGFYHDQYAFRVNKGHESVGDLAGQFLLDLKPSCEYFYSPGEFTESYDFPVRNIGDVNLAIEGQQMMFTGRIECDILFHYHLAVIYMESTAKMRTGILFHSAVEFFIHPCDPVRGIQKPLPGNVFADAL